MIQVTVIKKMPLKELPCFEVRTNGTITACFSFQIGANEESIYNEEKNRLAAMDLAKAIEAGSCYKEEVIYQTPAN